MHMAHRMNIPAHFGIRTKRYKLIFFYGVDYTNVHDKKQIMDKDGNRYWDSTPAAWEFYDLKKDPREMHNQYSNPEYHEIISEMKQMLKQKRKEIGDTDDKFPRIKKIVQSHWDK